VLQPVTFFASSDPLLPQERILRSFLPSFLSRAGNPFLSLSAPLTVSLNA
jgi:hypothetical protein